MDILRSDHEETDEEKKPEVEQPPLKRQWGPQIVGAMIGAFIFMIIGGLANQMGWQIGQTGNLWLWGAVIGGFVGAADSLAAAGSRLTKSDNRLYNIFVSFLGILVLLIFVYGVSRLTSWILKLFNL